MTIKRQHWVATPVMLTAIALVIMLLSGFFSSPIVAFSQSLPNVSNSSGSQDDEDNNKNSSNNNKIVILVFDRAYKSQLTNGKPLLDSYGYKATIFAVCNWIDNKKSIMSWEEIESLHKQGYDIQSHGMNHKDLRSLSSEEREFEVGQSKKCLHDHGINSTIYSAGFNRGGDDPEIIDTIAKYYDFGFLGHSTLMFLRCDGWEKFGFDESNYKGQTNCRTFFDDGTPTPTNRYSIKEWSHDREHNRINEKYPDNPPHGSMISEILFDKFVEIVNSQTKFNLNGEINAIPLITYHGISDNDSVSTSEELFAKEMKYLHDNGFRVLTASDLDYNENDNYFFIKE